MFIAKKVHVRSELFMFRNANKRVQSYNSLKQMQKTENYLNVLEA